MELAKKPVRFLCNASADTFRISVPKTEHHYLFYKNQPYLVKFDLDIEFFDEHLMFDRAIDPEPDEIGDQENPEGTEVSGDTPGEEVDNDSPEENPERPPYDKEELQKMRKSDVREILKKLAPEKSCPIRKENIVKEILKAQESK